MPTRKVAEVPSPMREDLASTEQDEAVCSGTSRLSGADYRAHLVQGWIPALDGVRAKLEKGALVADVACGRGAATILLAEAFPRSHFFAYDDHAPSVARAHAAASAAGVDERITFEVAGAQAMPRLEEAGGYDLITFFDCLGALADPTPAARWAIEALAPGGTVLVIEPRASEASLRDVFSALGVAHVRRVAESALHRVFEVRR